MLIIRKDLSGDHPFSCWWSDPSNSSLHPLLLHLLTLFATFVVLIVIKFQPPSLKNYVASSLITLQHLLSLIRYDGVKRYRPDSEA